MKLDDVHTIVISHAHPDHMGAMDVIYEKINPSDVKIIINKIIAKNTTPVIVKSESISPTKCRAFPDRFLPLVLN